MGIFAKKKTHASDGQSRFSWLRGAKMPRSAQMDEIEQPQIYLITPPEFELDTFPDRLKQVLDTHQVACVRLSLATRDEDRIARAADACREVTHARDIALVIDSHILMVERLGLDGVHLLDGPRSVRAARKELGEDAIVGAFCGTSRHDGMNAGEAGADYVSFGPIGSTGLGDGSHAEREIFEWWSEVIEVPIVAEGGLDAEQVASFAPVTDFLAFGEEIWREDDAAAALGRLISAIG
jgi:thiamine-phosphate pyrophosphorylase